MWIIKYKTRDVTSQVVKFEQRLEIALPEQYRAFILKYNGGKLRKASINLNGISTGLRYFYGFVKSDVNHSINNKYNKSIQDEFLTKQSVVGIAESGLGDIIAIGVNELDGQIFFCDHDYGYQITKLVDSFKEFVENIDSERINKDTLEHPDDKIKRITIQDGGRPPGKLDIEVYWTQYNEALNAIQEEVIID